MATNPTTHRLLRVCLPAVLLVTGLAGPLHAAQAEKPANLNLDAGAAPVKADQKEPAGQLLDRIVAVVNDDVILESELEQQTDAIARQLEQKGTSMPPESVLRRQVLDRMISNRLQLQMADKAGIQISDDQLNQVLTNIARRNGVTFSELPDSLAKQGVDYKFFRQEIRKQIIMHRLQQEAVQRRVAVTPREIDQYLANRAATGEDSTQYHISHILVALPDQASADEVQKAQAKARAIYDKLANGADFARTAIAESDGQQALQGGDLGWRRSAELPTIFAEQVRHMKVGEVSDPIRSASGFHIIKLDDKKSNDQVVVTQYHARHILVHPNELVSPAQARRKIEDIYRKLQAGGDFAQLARDYSDDPGSAAQAGDLGWATPDQYVPK
ncbi:MAG: peptidylprolyl isomerase, partial [Gammaproteobacteria bacterium]